MKQQKFLFVELVSPIFLLILLISNFLGLLYILEGNIVFSMLGSIFMVICYYFDIQLLKKNKEAMLRRKYIHYSLLFWVFFILLGFVSFILMAHFINIEFTCKEQIKSEATRKINLVDSIAGEYKIRAKSDVQSFNAVLKSKLLKYQQNSNDVFVKMDLATYPFSIKNEVLLDPNMRVDDVTNATVAPWELIIENNIKNLDTTITRNSGKFQSIFDNWKRLSLVSSYTKLNEYVDENLKMINSKLKDLPMNDSLINLSYNKSQLPLNSPIKLYRLYSPNLSIPFIVILVIHLFILIPFFTEKIRGGYSDSVFKKQSADPLELENVREI